MTECELDMQDECSDMRDDKTTISVGPAGRVAREFWRARRASVALESAAVISVLIVVAAGLTEVFSSVYMQETMDRAARAAARAVALSPDQQADAAAVQDRVCGAIKRELHLPAEFDCAAGWTVAVDTGLTTENLLNDESPDNRIGDMVRVSIGWNRQAWSFNADSSETGTTTQEISIGTARSEPSEIVPDVDQLGVLP